MIDRRIAAALLVVLGIGLGWGARMATETRLPTSTPPAPPIMPSSASASAGGEEPRATASPASSQEMQRVFEDIYRNATWGKNANDAGYSGVGSLLRATLLYRTFLTEFMKEADIHSVVDAGCGDWEFSQTIDWTGIDYQGFDIAASVIERDKAKFTKPNVHFTVGNIVDDDLPPADLLICKHVLQHLPTASVEKFLTQLHKYKHVLLINGVNVGSLSAKNHDIAAGEYRPLDVTAPPFNLRGAKLLTYWDGANMQQVVYISGTAGQTPMAPK